MKRDPWAIIIDALAELGRGEIERRARHERTNKVKEYNMKTVEGRRAWVFACWEALALKCYEYYKQFGRGAAVITGDLSEPDLEGFKYAQGEDPDPRFTQTLAEYDPENEIVVIFVLRGYARTIGRYLVENSSQTPAAIYKRQFN